MSKFTHFAALTSIYFQESLLSFWGHLEVEVRQGLGDGFRIEARIVIHESDADSLKVVASPSHVDCPIIQKAKVKTEAKNAENARTI